MSFEIVPYSAQYAEAISQLYHDAIHGITHPRYSHEQLCAWSAHPRSKRHWHQRLSRSFARLVIDMGTEGSDKPQSIGQRSSGPSRLPTGLCFGFINVEHDFNSRGYIDSLYIAPAYQGKGLAKALYRRVEAHGVQHGYQQLSVDASYLSRPLFEAMGFRLIQRSYQEKRGQMIPGFYLQKRL